MGSWNDLDAIYPPGALTPATALVVALGRLAGASGVFDEGRPAAWLPRGLPLDADLAARAGRYLRDVPPDAFLAEARDLLHPGQRRCLLLNLLDAALASGEPPASNPRFQAIVAGLGATLDDLRPHYETLALKNDLSGFPQ